MLLLFVTLRCGDSFMRLTMHPPADDSISTRFLKLNLCEMSEEPVRGGVIMPGSAWSGPYKKTA